jgi:lysophospholipase L1-like esterase
MTPTSFHNQHLRELAQQMQNEIKTVVKHLPTFSSGTVVYRKIAWDDITDDFEIFNNTTDPANSPFQVVDGYLNTTATRDGFNKNIMTKFKTADTDFLVEMDFTMNTVTSTNLGPTLALISTNASSNRQFSTLVSTDLSSGTNKGNFRMYTSQTGISGLSTSIGSPTINDATSIYAVAGQSYRLSLAVSGRTIFGRFTHIQSGQSYGSKIDINLQTGAGGVLPNTSRIAITCQGGDFTVTNLSVKSFQPTRSDLLFIGDSKTRGQSVNNFAQSFPLQVSELSGAVVANHSGSGDGTREMLPMLKYLLTSFAPTYVVLNIGRNEIGSIPSATLFANYTSIVDTLIAANVKVIHILPIPETSAVNQTGLTNYITTTYGPGTGGRNHIIVNPADGWNNATMLYTDNIHPTVTGMKHIAFKINEKLISNQIIF